MTRIIFTYGLISGFVVIAVLGATLLLTGGKGHSVWLGYLVMLVALSSILVGVKQYRDRTLGGVIRFRTALILGLGIALVASLAYVVLWEGYDAATGRSFMGHYIENVGEGPVQMLELFRSDHFADVSLNQWLGLTPAEVVAATLNLDRDTVAAMRKDKPLIMP